MESASARRPSVGLTRPGKETRRRKIELSDESVSRLTAVEADASIMSNKHQGGMSASRRRRAAVVAAISMVVQGILVVSQLAEFAVALKNEFRK